MDAQLFAISLNEVHSQSEHSVHSIADLVAFALDKLPLQTRIEIQQSALANDLSRQKLYDVWQTISSLERNGSAPGESATPFTNPFIAEVHQEWSRIQVRPDQAPVASFDFVGRRHELDVVRRWIRSGSSSVLQITGTGGVGKTCLLRKIAGDSGPQKLYYIECASLTNASEFLGVLASSLDANGEDLGDFLSAEPVCVLLDGGDQLDFLEAEITKILGKSTETRFIVSTRTPILIGGSEVFQLEPFKLGNSMEESEAESFFNVVVAKANTFRSTPTNVRLIRELCRFTQGLPLSLTLAAACLASLDLPTLVDRLNTATQGVAESAEKPVYASTVNAMSLLSAQDQTNLKSLSTFAGSFTFDDAQHLLACSHLDLSRSLTHLQQFALIHFEVSKTGIRYQMHDKVRDIVRGQTGVTQQLAQIRYASHFTSRAETIGALLQAGNWAAGLQLLWTNLADIRNSLEISHAWRDHVSTMKIAHSLCRPLFEAGLGSDFTRFAEQGMTASHTTGNLQTAADLLGLVGAQHSREEDEAACERSWLQRYDLCVSIEDWYGATDALTDLAWQAFDVGDIQKSSQLADLAVAVSIHCKSPALEGTIRVVQAQIAAKLGDREESDRLAALALDLITDTGDEELSLFVHQNLALLARDKGEWQLWELHVRRALTIAMESQRMVPLGWSLRQLHDLNLLRGDIERAARCLSAAVKVYAEGGTKQRASALRALDEFLSRHAQLDRYEIEKEDWRSFARLV